MKASLVKYLKIFSVILCVTLVSCGDDDDDDNNDEPQAFTDNGLSFTLGSQSLQVATAETLFLSQTANGFTVVTAADTLNTDQIIIFALGFEGTSTGSYNLEMGLDDDSGNFVEGLTITISSDLSGQSFTIYEAVDVTLEVEEISTSAVGFTSARFSGTMEDIDTGDTINISDGTIVAGVR